METVDGVVIEGRLDEVHADHERDRLKMRVAVLEESVRSYEVECKASRETVMRLVAEVDRERRNAVNSAEALDLLKLELNSALLAKRNTEVENRSLVERLEAGRRVVEAAKREAGCLERQVQELDRRVHASRGETEATRGQLGGLREKLVALLLDRSGGELPADDGEILQSLSDLRAREETMKTSAVDAERRLSHASEEASRQTELHRGAVQRARLAEQQVQDLRERLQALETELLTADVHRDGLTHSRQHYERFLEQLSEKMRVDGIAADLGFDMRLQLVLSRAEQLVKQEGTALVESKTLAHSLQRKLKALKERLESKELHTELLRKKVCDLEEERRSRSALAVERDDAHLAARRMQQRAARLQGELGSSKLTNTELRAQLAHTNELKLKVLEQTQTVEEQSRKLAELETLKAEVEGMLSVVRSDLQSQEGQAREDRMNVTALRQSLAQLTERERELVDFRTVVSQMVGLDIATLALPNYEIIKYLDSLLHTHHHHHLLHHLHHPQLHPPALAWSCPAHPPSCPPQAQDRHDNRSSATSSQRSAPALALNEP